MTENQTPWPERHGGPGNNDRPATGPIGPQPKRSQPMAQNSLIENDSPDDVETGAQSNPKIERS